MSDKEINLIGSIDFRDIQVPVYHDPYAVGDNYAYCVWRMRNPDSCYNGLMYMSYQGKISYPEDAVIPEQTDADREMIPLAIIVSSEELNDEIITATNRYLDKEYKRRNSIKN